MAWQQAEETHKKGRADGARESDQIGCCDGLGACHLRAAVSSSSDGEDEGVSLNEAKGAVEAVLTLVHSEVVLRPGQVLLQDGGGVLHHLERGFLVFGEPC
eukprot:CAMPEP_0173243286 /NCGR_PEP_ID=MMETSP1142-20121109/15417_1 /TAXON_ID=483371 /ORGANISM="non described non described, Strain CCMP2298" /LENGTH=100 /DNA_ID=CAMNT_0014174861 /DNA_START=182 /DNA_END=485 /DNA_ORIENTATION=+